MVRNRLITVLTFNNGVLYRTRNFTPDYRYTLNFTDAWSVDEIVLIDITRPEKGNKNNFYDVVKSFASNCFVPITVGGEIKSLDDINYLLDIGADKVSINTAAINEPIFISDAAQRYGSQCIVVSIDAKYNNDTENYEIYSSFGSQLVDLDIINWAKECQEKGAGEILIQSIDRDGMLEGYDNKLNKIISDAVQIPVLACSGAGNWQHFVDGFTKGGASAVCTTNIYHFTDSSIQSAKKFLINNGINVRI